jgi:carbon-monoxide dehydrogenase iron sulfur subunit
MILKESEFMEQKTFFIRAEFCTGCGLCQLACSLVKEKEANPAKSRIFIKRAVMDGLMMPRICVNCKQPPCVEACRRKAIIQDAQTGWVTIDKEKCNNCTLCIAACPFGAIITTPQAEVLLCDVCGGNPKCVEMCPTGAIQFADRSQGIAGTTDTAAVDIWKS